MLGLVSQLLSQHDIAKTGCLSSKPDFHFRGVKKYTMLADTTLHNFLLLNLHFQNLRDRRFCKKGQVHDLVTVRNISTEFGERINAIILDHDEGDYHVKV